MRAIHTSDQVRAAERAAGEELTSGRLMAKAAAGLAKEVRAELRLMGKKPSRSRLLLLVGPGDNGGDGLLAGADLARQGATVTAWAAGERIHAAGAEALRQAGGAVVEFETAQQELDRADLVIDAVFGIGARPGLPPLVAWFARYCDRWGPPVVSADLPSGLVADLPGGDQPSFQASRTVVFGAWKPCHVLRPALERCGRLRLIDLGLTPPPARLAQIERADLVDHWPRPGVTADKYARGVVAVDTGSPAYPGAAVLGVLGAVQAGAGLVKYVGPCRQAVSAAAPNVVCPPPGPAPRPAGRTSRAGWAPQGRRLGDRLPGVGRVGAGRADGERSGGGRVGADRFGDDHIDGDRPWDDFISGERPGGDLADGLPDDGRHGGKAGPAPVRADAWLIGSGWGKRADGPRRLAQVLDLGLPTVVDAEAIDCFARWLQAGHETASDQVLLTPHAGELARLLGTTRGEVEADPLAAARAASRRSGATVLLKGATGYVASPNEWVHLCLPGPAWTAQGGSGDVLAGIAAALLAAGQPPDQAGWLAGSVQALAAARHPGPHPPQELARRLPETIAALLK
jgi:hydroxyethylthiazole kinase-like uncharacterized protein yjeF